MVSLRDVCAWFQGLTPWKRIDTICELFQTCLPLELRFFGAVLEELCGKEYNGLREAENKANTRCELDRKNPDLPIKILRAHLIVSLSLLHSRNRLCANILCEWIEGVVKDFFSTRDVDENILEEVFLILTLAIHHPALGVRDRERITEHYETIERQHADKLAKNDADREDLLYIQKIRHHNRIVEAAYLAKEKVRICHLEVVSTQVEKRKNSSKVQVQVSLSNGTEVTVQKTVSQLQDFTKMLQETFPTEVKPHNKDLSIQFHRSNAHHHHNKEESPEKQLKEYAAHLLKLPESVQESDVFLQFFLGELPSPPPPQHTAILLPQTPCPVPMCHQPFAAHLSPPSFPPDQQAARFQYSSPPGVAGGPLVSSSLDSGSTASSQSNSPNSSRPPTPSVSGATVASVTQLLNLLNLDRHSAALSKYSVEQLWSLSAEELSKSGLSPAEQHLLRSKLDHIREKTGPGINGLVEVPAPAPGPTALPGALGLHGLVRCFRPVLPPPGIPPQLAHLALYPSAVVSSAPEASPPNSETSSPSHSPSPQQAAGPYAPAKVGDSSGSEDVDRADRSAGKEGGSADRWRGPATKVYPMVGHSRPLMPQFRSMEDQRSGPYMGPPFMDGRHDIPPSPQLTVAHNGYTSDPTPLKSNGAHTAYSPMVLQARGPRPAHVNSICPSSIINMPSEASRSHPGGRFGRSEVAPLAMQPVGDMVPRHPILVPMLRPPGTAVTRSLVTTMAGSSSSVAVTTSQHHASPPPKHGHGHSQTPPLMPGRFKPQPTPPPPPPLPPPPPPMVPAVGGGDEGEAPKAASPVTSALPGTATTVSFSAGTPPPPGPMAPPPVSSPSGCHAASGPDCVCNCHSLTASTPSPSISPASAPPTNSLVSTPWFIPSYPSSANGMHPTMHFYGPPIPVQNGLNPEMYQYYPSGASSQTFPMMPTMYGSYLLPWTTHPSVQQQPKKNAGCYNCGSLHHKAVDCNKNTMDNIGQFHLKFKPESD